MGDGEKRKGDGTIYSKKIIGRDLIFNSKCVKTRLVVGLRLDLLVSLSFSRRPLAALNGQGMEHSPRLPIHRQGRFAVGRRVRDGDGEKWKGPGRTIYPKP